MTSAIRTAESAGIEFSIHRYEHDANADSFGQEAAEKLGVSPNRLFKTLIAQIDGKQLVMTLIPVAARLDLKKLAALMKGKKAELAAPAAAERATGYVVGGISPFGQKRRLPAVIDESTLGLETVHVSAGRRGLEIALAPADLVRLAGATVVAITRD